MLKLGSYGLIRWGRVGLSAGRRGLISIFLWGSILASVAILFQPDLKRIAAYSSIVHMVIATAAIMLASASRVKRRFLVTIGHGISRSAVFCWVGTAQFSQLTRNPIVGVGLRGLGGVF